MSELAKCNAAPVAGKERINSIDTLRGIAVCGILVMNIYAYAMPYPVAYFNPLAYGMYDFGNLGTWIFTHLFFDQKFLPIFSMLYGAGIVLMADRASARNASVAALWYRRSFWLLFIGAAHAYLIWVGDILFPYALIGMLAFLFRNRSPRSLIIIASLVLPVAMLLNYSGGLQLELIKSESADIAALAAAGEQLDEEQRELLELWEELAPYVGDPGPIVERDIDAYTRGYAHIVAYRAPQALQIQTQGVPFFLLWRVGGLMLLGMALMKLGIFSATRSEAFYRRLMAAGYGVGFPVVIFSAWFLHANSWEPMITLKLGQLPNYAGSIPVAIGHVALIMLLVKRGVFARLMARFQAVGRMALTNYLAHSIIMTTLFYGYGLGLYGEVPRLAQMAFVVALVSLQLWYSPLWLRAFRFGPAEWLWRSLTYWKLQPLKQTSA